MNTEKGKDLNQYTDDELLSLIRSKDSNTGVSVLFLRYKMLVKGICLKYFKNLDRAEDESMAVYEKLLQKLKVHEVSNFKSWLHSLTRNHCLEKLRTEKNRAVKIDEAIIMYSDQVFHLDNKALLEGKIEQLNICIAKLNEMQQQCIKWFYYSKKSYQEISEELNIQWSEVRSNIQNGRRNLKICLESSLKTNNE